MQYDLEIIYVQKLFYFLFLATFTLLISMTTLLLLGLYSSQIILGGGLLISYLAMVKKKNFTLPKKKETVMRMARSISMDTSPSSIASFASQLYYYLHQPAEAISLLEKFLTCHDPVICSALSDILHKEGKTQQALKVLRNNPYANTNPLLLATQGHILKQIDKITEATRMFEQSLVLAKINGFPQSGSNWLTQKLLTLSYKAFIHHKLADCYVELENLPNAKRHFRAGNRLLFDLSLWRFHQSKPIGSPKNYMKSL